MSLIEIRSCHLTPLDKNCPVAMCYCEEPHCDVREVTVAYQAPSLLTLSCPSCGRPMRLAGYIEEELIHLTSPDEITCR